MTLPLKNQEFQLTRSRGARLTSINLLYDYFHFNSRAHVERDVSSSKILLIIVYFNSRAHVERDNPYIDGIKWLSHFNSRAHVERDSIDVNLLVFYTYFNSRAHVERDHNEVLNAVTIIDFNSRAHVERDIILQEVIIMATISTHALTWSATRPARSLRITHGKFQLTRSRGARPQQLFLFPRLRRFQLTRSRGARPAAFPHLGILACHFNSRAHVERDDEDDAKFIERLISTHALTWSATGKTKFFPKIIRFQLTRSRGARLARHCFFHQHSGISTHALTWSATAVGYNSMGKKVKFQLTRSRGARLSKKSAYAVLANFNSRAHVERDPRKGSGLP